MNKHLFCILFNQAKGAWVVVRESALARGAARFCGCLPMLVRGVAVLAVLQPTLLAFVVPAPPHGPTVTATDHDIPLVLIAAPNAAGLSSNHYLRFDVDGRGLILNNAQGSVETVLAGLVAGNPHLAGGSASVILNQVLGAEASQFAGALEVAGRRADVILANPNGIVCNGGSFINANRGVLTTGSPFLDGQGGLAGFRVTGGRIEVGPGGLDARAVDQVDLIARSLQVNGAIQAKGALHVTTGANEVGYADRGVKVLPGAGGRPTVGVDVSLLGGMYANRIHLIGTEAGVGVNSQGVLLAQGGGFTCDQQGRIVLTGRTVSAGPVVLKTQEGLEHTGTLYAQGEASLDARELRNTGTLAAGGHLTVKASEVVSTGVLGAGITPEGQATLPGHLEVTATGRLQATGGNASGGTLAFTGGSLVLDGARTAAAGDLTLRARDGGLDHRGALLQSGGTLTATVAGTLVNDHGWLAARQMHLTATTLDNRHGELENTGTGRLKVETCTFTNDGGLVTAQGPLALSAIEDLGNAGGVIQASGALRVHGRNVLNDGGRMVALGGPLTVLADERLENAAGTTALGSGGGVLGGRRDAVLQAGSITSSGSILAGSYLSVSTPTLVNSGTLRADGRLEVQGEALTNAGGRISAPSLALTVPQLDNSRGEITGKDLRVTATDLLNAGGTVTHLGTGATPLKVSGTLANTGGGRLQSGAPDLRLAPRTLDNSGGALVHAGPGTLTLDLGPGALLNTGGTLTTAGALDATAGTLRNQGGAMVAQGRLGLTVTGAELDNGGAPGRGGYLGGAQVRIATLAGPVLNPSGLIEGRQGTTLHVHALDNTGGTLASLGDTLLDVAVAGRLGNGRGLIGSDGRVQVAAQDVQNAGGRIQAPGEVRLDVGSLDNTGGAIGNGPLGTGSVHITARGGVVVSGGTITSARDLTLNTRALQGGGVISGGRDANVTMEGDYTHQPGVTLTAARDLTLATRGALTNAGTLDAPATLTVRAVELHNQASGSLQGRAATFAVDGTFVNAGGVVAEGLSLTARELRNTGGRLVHLGAEPMTLEVAGTLANTGGGAILTRGRDLKLEPKKLDNTGGLLGHAGAGTFAVTTGDLSNAGGRIATRGGLALTVDSLDNTGGRVGTEQKGTGSVQIRTAQTMTNAQGWINAAGDLGVRAGALVGEGSLTGGQDTLLHLQAPFTHKAPNWIYAGRDLVVGSEGAFTNASRLEAPRTLKVEAKELLFETQALLQGGETLEATAADSLRSLGSLFSREIKLKAGGLILNGGPIEAQGAATLTSSGKIHNVCFMATQGNLVLNAADIETPGDLGAGLDRNGKPTQPGNLTLTAAGQITVTGRSMAGGALTFTGASLALPGAKTYAAGDLTLAATGGSIAQARGADLQTLGTFTASAPGALVNDQSRIAASQVDLRTDSLSNQGGTFLQTGPQATRLEFKGAVDNTGGVLTANGESLTLVAGRIDNSNHGAIRHAGSGTLELRAGGLNNQGGRIATRGDAVLSPSSLLNDDGVLSTGRTARITVAGGDLSNARGIIRTRDALVLSARAITNAAGQISAQAGPLTVQGADLLRNTPRSVLSAGTDLQLHPGRLENGGTMEGARAVVVRTDALENRGLLQAGQTLDARGGTLDNHTGQIIAPGLTLVTPALVNTRGRITADSLNVEAGTLDNAGGQVRHLGSGPMTLAVGGTLTNTQGGLIESQSRDLSIAPRALDNTGGALAHAGAGTLAITVAGGGGTLTNTLGSVASNGALGITAAGIRNEGGALAAQQRVTLTVNGGALENHPSGSRPGSIRGDQVVLEAPGAALHNQGGTLEGSHGVFVRARELDNSGGTLRNTADGVLDVAVGTTLVNTRGVAGSAGRALVAAQQVVNTEGTLEAGTDLRVTSGSGLENTGGALRANGSLDASARDQLTNVNGRIEAGATGGSATSLAVTATVLDNGSGRIVNTGTQATTVTASQRVVNANAGETKGMGLIEGAGDVRIHTPSLYNHAAGQLASGANLTLENTGLLDNTGGRVHAQGHLRLHAPDATVTNAGGLLSAGAGVDLQVANLFNTRGTIGTTRTGTGEVHLATGRPMGNAEGTVTAGADLFLTTPAMPAEGRLQCGRDAHYVLQGDYTLPDQATLSAPRNLTLTLPGRLLNLGSMVAPDTLTVQAGQVSNVQKGLFSGRTTRVLSSHALLNTGRIFGEDIALGASSFTNRMVVAARGSLNIGAGDSTNQGAGALLLAEGNLAIGRGLDDKGLATGQADRIVNAGATMQSGNGDLDLSAATILNEPVEYKDRGVTTKVERNLVVIQPKNMTQKFLSTELTPTTGENGVGGCWLLPRALRGLGRVDDYTQFTFTRTTTVSNPPSLTPGQILAKRNLRLTANQIRNDKSRILAGRTLTAPRGALQNLDFQVETVVKEVGTALYADTSCKHKWGRTSRKRNLHDRGRYAPAPTLTRKPLGLAAADVAQPPGAATPSGQGQASAQGPGSPAASLGLSGNNPTTAVLASGAPGKVAGASGGATPRLAGGGPPQTVGDAVSPIPGLSLPNTLLHQVNPSHGAPCLVETDAMFLGGQTYEGLDHMLDHLGLASGVQRFGDGFLETQQLGQQIRELTGRMAILPGTASANQEYRTLMDHGLAAGRTLNLRPGVMPTDAQQAALTQDCVWPVYQEVALERGGTARVLVPVLFLAPATAARGGAAAGALISAGTMDLNLTGDLENTGTLRADDRLAITAAGIENKGRVATPGEMALTAQGTLLSEGALQGHRVALNAGEDVVLQTTTRTTHGASGTRTALDQVAQVDADALSVVAGRDLKLRAAQIHTTGAASLTAGRDLDLGAVDTRNTERVGSGQNHHYQSASEVVGTRVAAGGDLTFQAGNNLTATAAYARSDAALRATAGGSVTLGAAHNTALLDEAHRHTERNTLSSSTRAWQSVQASSTAVGSTFSGDTLALEAGQGLTLTGSAAVGTRSAELSAGGDVVLEAATNTLEHKGFSHTKDSGMGSGGRIGVSFGSRKETHQFDQHTILQSQSRSMVAATHGSVTLTAKRAAHVTGSDLAAGEDVKVRASEILMDPGQDRQDLHERHEFKSSGLTIGVGGGVLDTAAAVASVVETVRESKGDSRVQLATAMAVDAVRRDLAGRSAMVKGGASATAASGIKISASIGASQSRSESHEQALAHAGSTVTAGRNLDLATTEGDLKLVGATLHGENISLEAVRNLVLTSAVDTTSSRSSSSSSNGSLGISAGVGQGKAGLSVDISVSRGRGNAQGDSATHQNTTVAATHNLTMKSGGDTKLIGAHATGKTVKVEVGGDLIVASQQDTFKQASKYDSAGVDVSIPIYGGGGGASVNMSQSRSNADASTVGDQAGILAGSGGYRINVGGNTGLKAAVLASTASPDQNHLTTSTLTVSELRNQATGSSSSSGFGIGTSVASSGLELGRAVAGAVLGQGHAHQSDASTTHSAIAAGSITLTNDAAQKALTGHDPAQTLATLRRDTQDTHRALARPDVAALDQDAATQLALNSAIVQTVFAYAPRTTPTYTETPVVSNPGQDRQSDSGSPQGNASDVGGSIQDYMTGVGTLQFNLINPVNTVLSITPALLTSAPVNAIPPQGGSEIGPGQPALLASLGADAANLLQRVYDTTLDTAAAVHVGLQQIPFFGPVFAGGVRLGEAISGEKVEYSSYTAGPSVRSLNLEERSQAALEGTVATGLLVGAGSLPGSSSLTARTLTVGGGAPALQVVELATVSNASAAGGAVGIAMAVYGPANGQKPEKKNPESESKQPAPQKPEYKRPAEGLTGKEAASNVPSWAKGNSPMKNENGRQFAERLLKGKYGKDWAKGGTGPKSEFNKLKKWGDRGFE